MYDAWYAVPNTADDETDESEVGERDGEEHLETVVDDVKACDMTWRDLGCIIDFKPKEGETKAAPSKEKKRQKKEKKAGNSGEVEAAIRAGKVDSDKSRHRKCFRKRPLDGMCVYISAVGTI